MSNKVKAALAVVVLAAFVTVAAVANATPSPKYWVCKYTGQSPNEVLKGGLNPISVNGNALAQPVVLGAFFADGQDSSKAVAEDTGQAAPTCPAGTVTAHVPVLCPAGTHKIGTAQNGDDVCEPDAVDVCDNIQGLQATVPANHTLNGKVCTENDAGDYTDGSTTPEDTTVEVFQGK